MKNKSAGTAALVAAGLLWAAAAPAAEDGAAKGLEIAREADRRDSGFGDYTADMEMVLRNRQGQESTRHMRFRVLERKDDGHRSLVYFDEPADVKGTAVLTFSHKTGNDDQWLYLPAVGRVKRISSSNKTGPFVGSEFSFEDLSSQEVEEFQYSFQSEESLDGTPCFVVERRPVDERSGYSKQIVWYDKTDYRMLKVDYYDRKGELLKTLRASGHARYLDTWWRPAVMLMTNHQTGKSTEVRWKAYKFRNGLKDSDFESTRLSSGW